VPRSFTLPVTAQPPHGTVIGGGAVRVAIKCRQTAAHFLDQLKYGRGIPSRQRALVVVSINVAALVSYFCDYATDVIVVAPADASNARLSFECPPIKGLQGRLRRGYVLVDKNRRIGDR
jgi:hypothetical protein